MQTLKTEGQTKIYDLKEEIRSVIRENLTPVEVNVSASASEMTVKMKFEDQELALSPKQALDLAGELRRAANKLGALQFQKLAKEKRAKGKKQYR